MPGGRRRGWPSELGDAPRGGRARRSRARAAPARGRARVARPGLRRRPLGAADDRAGRRRGRARPAGREVAHGRVGRGRGGRARRSWSSMPCGYYAEQAAAETMPLAQAPRPSSARAWWRWTPRPTSRGPGRAWWTASSCSATCCTPSWCRRRRRGARSSWTSSAPAPVGASRPTAIEPDHGDAAPSAGAEQVRPSPAARAACSGSSNSTSAASAPPISPPMWPPIEMPGHGERDQQVEPDPEAEAALHRVDAAVAHHDHGGAHQAEDAAGGAHRRASPDRTTSAPNEPASSETK